MNKLKNDNLLDEEKKNQKGINIEKIIDIKEALDIRDMVNDNMDLEEISKITGRTVPEIKRVMEVLTGKKTN